MSSTAREITVAKSQRRNAKTSITKDFNKLPALFDASDTVGIETLLAKIESQYRLVVESNNFLARSLDDDSIEAELEKVSEYTEHYTENLARYQVLLKRAEKAEQSASQQNRLNVSTNSDRSAQNIKLPKLEIAKFDGDPANWQEFWDSYEATIHEHTELSAVDKFKYLKSYLTKDAFRLADGYKLTSANYDTVVECLQQRYGNPELAIFQHFENLLAISVSTGDLRSLHEVNDDCERHIRSLVALGLEEDTFGRVFVPIILSKLPKFLRIDLNRQNGLEPWTLAKLRTLLKQEIQVREMSQHTFGTPTGDSTKGFRRQPQTQNNKHRQWRPQNTASNLLSGESSKPPKCMFCSGPHASESCRKVVDSLARRSAVKGRCFVCLRDDHMAMSCRSRRKCKHCNSPKHHPALCPKMFPSDSPNDPPGTALNATAPAFIPKYPNSTLISHSDSKITYLHTAIAKLSPVNMPKPSVNARLVFDTASSRTYITHKLCRKLGVASVSKDTLSVGAFRSKKQNAETHEVVQLSVVCKDGSMLEVTALVIDHICNPVALYPVDTVKYPSLKELSFAEPLLDKPIMGDVDVLIGGDWYYKFVTGIEKVGDDLVLLSTRLGYMLGGTESASCLGDGGFDSSLVSAMLRFADPIDTRNQQLERFWSLEEIGICDRVDSKEDDIAMDAFQRSVVVRKDRYYVQWPWKVENPDLPTNFHLAYGQLRSLKKRLDSEPEILSAYSQTLCDQLKNEVIEIVDPGTQDGLIHYLPHHCVIRSGHATTKLRIVHDASAKSTKSALSLNDCLLRGPVLLRDICGLLLRFRLHKVGLIADLEKAFLQVALQKDQRDVSRFLWLKDTSKPVSYDNLIIYRFCRVLFGVVSSPFLLAATVALHLSTCTSPVAKQIAKSIYVDNVICGVPNIEAGVDFYRDAKGIFNRASMNLREWYTNDSTLTEQLPAKDKGCSKKPKVLGLPWDLQADTISSPKIAVDVSGAVTKRKILQAVASVFDPCGLISPVVVLGKCLLQELWKSKFDWDTKVPPEIERQWKSIFPSLQSATAHKLPRYVGYQEGSQTELHCFCDASTKAYSAVVYLVVRDPSCVASSIMFCKTRVSPLQAMTIPKLELLGVFIGSKILSFVDNELQLPDTKKFIWSDSKCVLHWVINGYDIDAKQSKSRFVSNRLASIKAVSDKVEFRYVPSMDNPADLGSRGCTYQVLSAATHWWKGPDWLVESQAWPVSEDPAPGLAPAEPEVGRKAAVAAAPCSATVDFLMDVTRFSKLCRLVRAMAWVFRFVDLAKGRGVKGFLTVPEIRKSKAFLIKRAQGEWFSGYHTTDPKLRSLKQNLGVFTDSSGLLRCAGRLTHAAVADDAKTPVLLPPRNHLTNLIISEVHQLNGHVGVNQTLAELRTAFWVPKGRSEVKRVINQCTVCRKAAGKHYQLPPQPPLPPFRVVPDEVFSTTGLDYLGPLTVQDLSGARKVWICLFTCAVVRAVHLEVVQDMSAEQFLLCLRRFCSLYGMPKLIISDNGSQLHSAHRCLVKLFRDNSQIQDFSAAKGVFWKFIPELSPWMGGFYERLVGIVKGCLKKSIGKRLLTTPQLQTVAAEVSSIVNNRPLTYIDEDSLSGPLTPSHFLAKRGKPSFPLFDTHSDDYSPANQSSDKLAMAWKTVQSCLNDFWQRWQREYLLSLRERMQNYKAASVTKAKVTENSVVLIKDNQPRGLWKMGKIVKLNRSFDDKVRSAVVTLGNGKNLVRPIKLLYPIEVAPENALWNTDNVAISVRQNKAASPNSRPKRKAAEVAKQRIRKMVDSDSCSD